MKAKFVLLIMAVLFAATASQAQVRDSSPENRDLNTKGIAYTAGRNNPRHNNHGKYHHHHHGHHHPNRRHA